MKGGKKNRWILQIGQKLVIITHKTSKLRLTIKYHAVVRLPDREGEPPQGDISLARGEEGVVGGHVAQQGSRQRKQVCKVVVTREPKAGELTAWRQPACVSA